jgi:hypothetical protein
MVFSWIRQLSPVRATSIRRDRRRAPNARSVRFRAALTVLEDRTLLTTNTWTGTGDWSTIANWSLGHVPKSTEDVFISNGSSVTHSTGSDTIKSLLTGNTATVVLSGGTITDPGTFDVPGTFTLMAGMLSSATVTSDTTISATSSTGTLNGITLQGTLDLRTTSSFANVSGGLTLSGVTVFLGNAAGSTFGQLYPSGAAETIDGASGHPGTITFGSSGSNGLFNLGGLTGTLTLGANLTIHGTAGQLSMANQAFDNKGTITADPTVLATAPATITMSGTNWTNDGTIQALKGDNLTLSGTASTTPATHAWTNNAGHTIAISGGGTLILESNNAATTADHTAWLNLGTITSNAGAVDLGGFFTFAGLGTYNRTGGTVNLTGTLNNAATTLLLNNTTGSWDLLGGTVNGGTVKATAGNALVGTGSTGTLIGVTLDSSGGNSSPLDMQTNTSFANVSGGLTLSGATLFLGNVAGTTFGELSPSGAAETIDGASGHPGTITLGSSGSNGLFNSGSLTGTLTLGANLTIHGTAGQLSMANQAFDNKGTITADPTVLGTAPGTITMSGTNWTNAGTIQAAGGDTIVAEGTISNFSANTLTGGTWKVFTNSTLELNTSNPSNNLTLNNLNSNAATLVLDGANSKVTNANTSADALTGFATNLAGGSLTVQDGRSLTTPAFSNAGTLVVGTAGTFSVKSGSDDTQTGGTTSVIGTGVLQSAGTGNFNLKAGVLQGTGTATFTSVINSGGQVNPGLSGQTGKLTIMGNYSQNAGGTLNIRLGGTAAGQFDQLAVSGVATLGGTLKVTLVNFFCTGAGDSFQFMTFGARSGTSDFATKNLPNLGGGVTLSEQTNATNALLNDSSPAATTVMNVTSTTPNGTYRIGASITIMVCISRVVTVTGTPRLALSSGGTANFTSGSGTSMLIFTYVVAAGQNSSHLDYTSTTALTLNGGSITDSNNHAAQLTLATPGTPFSLGANKNIVIDTTAPTVTNVTSTTANGTYGVGATITITISFSEAVTVTGTPQLALNSGGTAQFTSGSGTNTLTFTYVVAAGQNSSRLDYTSTTALTLNGGTITDADGSGNAANLTLGAPGAAGSLGANKNIVIKT